MEKFSAGILIRQRAVDWWPHLATMVKKINQAAETFDNESLNQAILNAAEIIKSNRKEVPLAEIREIRRKLQRDLKNQIEIYAWHVKHYAMKLRAIRNPQKGNKGRPLKESTLCQYKSIVKAWPDDYIKDIKQKIKKLAGEIKRLPSTKARMFLKNDVKLSLHYGGKYPAQVFENVCAENGEAIQRRIH